MYRREFLTKAACLFLVVAPSTGVMAEENERVFAVSSGGNSALSAQILAYTNAQRRAAGRAPLKQSRALTHAAQDYAHKLASAGRLSHSLGGAKPGSRARAAGYNWRAIGENIAFGNGRGSDQQVAAGLVRQWMGSNGHRKNILATKYSAIGVGSIKHGGRAYGVQMFGRPR